MMLVESLFSRRQKQQMIIFAVVAGFPLGGWGQCICYYVKLTTFMSIPAKAFTSD